MKPIQMIVLIVGAIFMTLSVCEVKWANGGELSEEMQRLQKQLNHEVMSKPFSVADEARVKSYIQDAQKRGEVPQPYRRQYQGL
jgi:sensor histidine kinase regulating citrate/malate metabolism